MQDGGVGIRGRNLVRWVAESGDARDAPIERSVDVVLVGSQASVYVGRAGEFATPEERRHEKQWQRFARRNAARISDVRCGRIPGWVSPGLKIVANLPPELRPFLCSRKGGQKKLAVAFCVNGGVARIVGEAADHVLHIFGSVGAAHIGGECQLKMAVQAVSRFKHRCGAGNVTRLLGPAACVQREAVDADCLGLLDFAFV